MCVIRGEIYKTAVIECGADCIPFLRCINRISPSVCEIRNLMKKQVFSAHPIVQEFGKNLFDLSLFKSIHNTQKVKRSKKYFVISSYRFKLDGFFLNNLLCAPLHPPWIRPWWRVDQNVIKTGSYGRILKLSWTNCAYMQANNYVCIWYFQQKLKF